MSKLYIRLLIAVLAFCLCSICCYAPANSESSSPSEWNMFGRFLNQTRYNPVNAPVNLSANVNLFVTGGYVVSSPVVANGVVYIGSNDKNVYALNASNIYQKLGNFTTGDLVGSTPAIADGVVYVGSYDNYVYALNASDITQKLGSFGTTGLILSSPAVANGVVYIGSHDHNVYALNASNISQVLGSFGTGGYITSVPAVVNGIVYIGSDDGNLYALNASNLSRQLGVFATGSIVSSSPAVVDGVVYIGSHNYNVYALNASNISQEFGHYTAGERIASSPAVANGIVYIGGSWDNNVYALNASNISQKLGSFATGDAVHTSPAVSNGVVYIGSSDRNFYALNASNISQQLDSYTTISGMEFSSAAVVDGVVYVGSHEGYIYAFGQARRGINMPNASNFSVTYGSTDFVSALNITSLANMVLATSTSKVQWNNSVNASSQNFDAYVAMGSGFVSLNSSALDRSLNSSATVSINVRSCDSWLIYYASQPVASLDQLKSIGSVVGTGQGSFGACTNDCSNPTCVGNVLTFNVSHFDSLGGEGFPSVPEFSGLTLMLALVITFTGLFVIRKNR